MITDASSASIYTDFQGLMQLKAEAGKQTPEAIRETARQFEALFVQMMLKSMRDASPGDGMFDSDQVGFYRELYDRQLALEMVKGRGLGIAGLLSSRLGGQDNTQEPGAVLENGLSPPLVQAGRGVQQQTPPEPLIALNSTGPVRPLIDVQSDTAVTPADWKTRDWRPESPKAFIRELLPHAREGAARLGVQPEVLVAQAALETGWGQKVIRHPNGRSSFNLFGIKADAGWGGDRVTVATLEYEGGIPSRQRAAFRSYDSLTESVSDYVEFLNSNPRYQSALAQAPDSSAFLHGLKAAGYATDPEYVEKIEAILQSESFHQDSAQLKLSRQPPLSSG